MKKKFDIKVILVLISGFAFLIAGVWRDIIHDVANQIVIRSGVSTKGYFYSFFLQF